MDLSVRESIVLCVKKKIKGADSQLKSFDKNGRLTTKNQLNALKNNLECIYKNVKITGGGKRGRVLLDGLRDCVIAKKDGRSVNKGQPMSEQQLIMNSYIYSILFYMSWKGEHMNYSLKGWTNQLYLFDLDGADITILEDRILDIHKNSNFKIFESSQIVKEFKNALYSMNISVVEKGFNWLSKEDKIEYEINYIVVNGEGGKSKVDKEKYNFILEKRRELLEKLGSSVSEYNREINNKKSKVKRTMEEVNNHILSEFDCSMLYKTYSITSITESEETINSSKSEFEEAYWDDFIARTQRRQKLYDSKYGERETWLWRKLWAFNTFSLMDYLGVDTKGFLIEREREVSERVKELETSYNKENNRILLEGFGFNIDEIDKELDFLLDIR